MVRDASPTEQAPTEATPVKAEYTGWCPGCDLKIEIGEEIKPGPHFGDNWHHVTCPDPLTGERLPPCRRCGLEHRGEC